LFIPDPRLPNCQPTSYRDCDCVTQGPQWRYLYRAIDKHGNPVDFLLTEKRDLDAAMRFFRKMLKDEPLLSPGKIGTDGANTFPSTIKTSVEEGLLHPDPVHYVTKHLQQGIESDHFRVKKKMPKVGGFRSFNTARRTIAGFEAMLWLRKVFGFFGGWTVNDQNDLLAACSDFKKLTKHNKLAIHGIIAVPENLCDTPLLRNDPNHRPEQ
jgi:IS6 family transposase